LEALEMVFEGIRPERGGLVMERFIPLAVVGAREKVFGKLDALISVTEADELIVLTLMHDQAARHRSFELLAEHRAFALG